MKRKSKFKLTYENKAALGIIGVMLALIAAVSALCPATALAYTQKEQIVSSGHGPLYNESYLVVHETANPGATAWNHVNYWRTSPYAVHYVMDLDGAVVYHTMSDDRKAWHVGNGNSRSVGIELCHATNQADFDSQWTEAVKWCGDYLNKRGWSVNRMVSHNEARLMWGGTDHTDPNWYFESYGKTWAQFKGAVAAYMASGQTGGTVEEGGSVPPASNTSGTSGTGFGGTYTVMASKLNIRAGASTGAATVGSYSRGASVVLDDWYAIRDGYVWGRYTAYSGNVRYVAVGKPTGGVSADDYLIKNGAAASGPSSGAGDYRVTASALNVRSGPGTGYRATGTLHNGYVLHVQSVSDGWAKYQAYSGTRYVSAKYLAAV